jgi:UDP-glucose 4-epimerase
MLNSLRGTRVLITGGLGFIGSNLARRCVDLHASVTIFDSIAPRSGANRANLEGFEPEVSLIIGDIRDSDALTAAMRNQDICIHAAAHTSHLHSMIDPLTDIDVNCKGVINLLEAARRVNPDVRIVYLATSTQVGPMQGGAIDEHHPERPVDIYSANKGAAEKYVRIYSTAHRLRATVVRLANVYGPRSNIRSADCGFVNYFIGLALQGQPITVYGDGRQLRNLAYVEDCVEAILLAATHETRAGDVFFAVSDQHYTVAHIAASIARGIGGVVRHVDWPRDRQAIEVGDAIISSARIASTLGWSAQTDLDTGLRRTREYFLPRLARYLDQPPVAALARGGVA